MLPIACTTYEVVTPSGQSSFDRSWTAALAAAAEVGVSVYEAERSRGTIRGVKDGSDVTIVVATQADGRVRVEFNVKDPLPTKSPIADALSAAYNRNMGR
jgi:hypothetical protein